MSPKAGKGLISGSKKDDDACTDEVFRGVFEKIQTGILIIDPDTHTIMDANPLAEYLIGRSKNELIGSTCHEFVCPAKCGQCPITDMHKDIHNLERALINAKGETIPILKTVAKATIHGREYLIESFIDILDRKRAEERKVALIAYMNESIMRVRTPLGLMTEDLQRLADQAKGGEYDAEEIRMQLQIHANNIRQMVRTLEELSAKAALEQGDDIPPEFRDFFIGK